MDPEERKRRFQAQAKLVGAENLDRAAKEHLGVTYHHLTLVMKGERVPSETLKRAFARFIGKRTADVWGPPPQSTQPTHEAVPTA